MEELFSSDTQDAATPLNSAGTPTQSYRNAAGDFDLKNKYGSRKIKSRRDLDQPKDGEEPMRDGTLPEYEEGPLATGGSQTDDPTKVVQNGGHIVYEDQPQASQTKYNNDRKTN
jgi:hypothetical protein